MYIRKKFLLILCLIICMTLFINAQSVNVILQYRCAESNEITNQIKPQINIKNNGTSSINLDDLKVRYYYTLEDPANQELHCDYAMIGSSKITGNFIQVEGNNFYLEISFNNAGVLDPGNDTGEIQLRFNKLNWTNYIQSDDYSFSPDIKSFTEYEKMTIYKNGELIWGSGTNKKPIVNFIYSPDAPIYNEIVTFDASSSYDPDGEITAYSWDFGDGSTETGAVIDHVYQQAGDYQVILTVTDDKNLSNSITKTIIIYTDQPVALFNLPASVFEPDTAITFDGSDSFDPDGTIVNYQWDFGDGITDTGVSIIHSYPTEDIYTVSLTVTDDAGNTNSLSRNIIITSKNADWVIPKYGNQVFLSGANVAWGPANEFSCDINYLDDPAIEQWFHNMFINLKASGANSIRWWIHADGAALTYNNYEDRMVLPITQNQIDNIRKVLDWGEEYGIMINLSLWSFDMVYDRGYGEKYGHYNIILTDDDHLNSYIDNFLRPLVREFKNHPALLSYEVCNEPEGMCTEGSDWIWGWTSPESERVDILTLQKFHNWIASAIHDEDPEALVTTGSWSFQASREWGDALGQINVWSDERLITAGGKDNGILDYYQVHYYSWGGEDLSPFHHPASYWNLDKPIVIGEFYCTDEAYFGVNREDLYTTLYNNGYAGAWGWTYSEDWDHIKIPVEEIKDEYPEYIIWEPGDLPNIPPEVSITTPIDGEKYAPGDIMIHADALDTDGYITKVEFYRNIGITPVLLGTDTEAPYEYVWENLNVDNYQVFAVAYDNDSESSESEAVNFEIISNTPPNVEIITPSNGDIFKVNDIINISADADDPDGSISKLEFYVNGTKIAEDTTAPYSTNWSTDTPDDYTVTVKAYDDNNISTATDPISIKVEKLIKNLLITNPANNDSFIEGDCITIDAAATDSITQIVLVEFYADSVKIGEDNTAPYSITVCDLNVGSHVLTVKAYSDSGQSQISDPINIQINPDTTQSKLKVQYRCMERSANTNSIRAHFNIINDGDENIPMSELELRYCFTLENPASQEFHCDYAQVGSSNVNGSFINISGDEYYTSISFSSGANNLNAKSNSGEIQTRWNKINWSNYNQSNDYSFNPDLTSFTDWSKVELYRNGIKIWPQENQTNQPPVINITNPSDSEVFLYGSDISISADANDNDGTVLIVEFYLDNNKIGEDTDAPYSITISNAALGSHTIEARATDDDNALTTSDPVNIAVIDENNEPPVVNLTSPTEGQTFTEYTDITISADASDSDGTVTKVEFYAGSSKIGEDTDQPYSIIWSNATNGEYSITAKATDNKGTATTSPAVAIIVESNQNELPYSSMIRLNQAGYYTNDDYKTAVISDMTGNFSIHKLSDDALVYSGTLTSLGNDSGTGENLYIADFSDFDQNGEFYIKVNNEKSPKFEIKDDLYDEVLYYTLRVYGANRCGAYDSWMHQPCHTHDGSIRGNDKAGSLTGGWHDCGDHVKFGGTLGYAAVMMLYSYLTWQDSFGDVYSMSYDGTYNNPAPDGIPDVINEVKVATDYLLNLYNASVEDGLTTQNKMYYQVGDGDDDHSWWHKPENQDPYPQEKGGAPREVWSDIASDLAGRFSASLAMMYLAYKDYDSAYAGECLDASKAIYEIGKNIYGQSGDTGGKGYYAMDTRSDDDMAMAAIMLYKATNDDYYINNMTGAQYWMSVENKWQFVSYYVLSYPNIFALALHAYYPYASTVDNDPAEVDTKIVTKEECIEWIKMDVTQPSQTQTNDIYGRKWTYDWGTCRYMMGVAATACLAHDLDPADGDMLKIAKDQMNWIFGRNQFGLSFVVGNKQDSWLTKYPEHPHHRAANPDGENIPDLDTYPATELTGATIGGPESHTVFNDIWDQYRSTETGIDYWAGTFFTAAYLLRQ